MTDHPDYELKQGVLKKNGEAITQKSGIIQRQKDLNEGDFKVRTEELRGYDEAKLKSLGNSPEVQIVAD